MKKTYKLRSLLLAGIVALATLTAHAELLLNENFEYTTTELYGNGSWWKYASNSEDPVSLVTPALTYAGYQDEAVGKSVKLGNTASGQDVYTMFDKGAIVGEGSIYVAMLINLTDATDITSSNAAYILGLISQTKSGLKDGGSGTEYGRLFAYAASEGKYKLAISRANTTLESTTAEYEYGKTYLVVMKYTIVEEGTTDDEVRLYVNPATGAEPATADALYNGTSGSDASLTAGGLAALELRQGATASKKAPVLTIDAIRVGTEWADLFSETGGGDTPDPVRTPTITPSVDKLAFASSLFYVGGPSATTTFTVKAADLKEDITLTASSANLAVSPATIAKEEAMTEEGVLVTVTYQPTSVEYAASVTLASADAKDVTLSASVYVMEAVKTLAELTTGFDGVLAGPVTVTAAYTAGSNVYYYVQDETAGKMLISYTADEFKDGDQLTGLMVYFEGGTTVSFSGLMGEKIPEQYVTPEVVTLAELATEKEKYAFRLVRINDITFSQTGDFAFGTQYDIAQGEAVAKLSLFAESDIIGTKLPQRADVVGVVRNAAGNLISPRTTADITPKNTPSALDNVARATLYTEAGMLCIDTEAGMAVAVYNLLGAQVATLRTVNGVNRIALPEGAYLVRVNGKASKVIVK